MNTTPQVADRPFADHTLRQLAEAGWQSDDPLANALAGALSGAVILLLDAVDQYLGDPDGAEKGNAMTQAASWLIENGYLEGDQK